MRILIATWVFPTHGGVLSFLDKVVPRLTAWGHAVDVLAVAPSPQSYRPFPHLPPQCIHNVRQLRLPRPFSFPLPSLILAAVRIAKRRQCDLIFSQDPFYSGLPSLFVSRLLRIPLIVADHGMITNFTEPAYWANFGFRLTSVWQHLSKAVIKTVLGGALLVYSPGDDITDRIARFFGGKAAAKTRTFPIGIDTDAFRPNAQVRDSVRRALSLGNLPTAIFVGRLHVESGLEYLIEAMRLLPRKTRSIVLVVGDGVLRPKYEEEAEAKVPGLFHFLGYSDRVAEYLNAADIFVFPKVFAGGYSISLREAMATGLPCIATRGVDSHDRIIENGANGILVPPRDPRAISEEMARLLSDRNLRAKLGSNARRAIVERFSIDSFGSQLQDLLRHASNRHKLGSG